MDLVLYALALALFVYLVDSRRRDRRERRDRLQKFNAQILFALVMEYRRQHEVFPTTVKQLRNAFGDGMGLYINPYTDQINALTDAPYATIPPGTIAYQLEHGHLDQVSWRQRATLIAYDGRGRELAQLTERID